MFCNQEIDPNVRYVAPEEDLGSLENTDYDTKLSINVVNDYLKNPKYKKYLVFAGVFVVLFIVIIILMAVSGLNGGVSASDVFISVVDAAYDYADETILYKNGHSGNASVEIKYNDSKNKNISYQFSGDYVFDPLNKYYAYNANLDGKYSSSDIKIDSKILPITFLFRDNTIYLTSTELSEKALSGDLSLFNEFFNIKDYDIRFYS